VRTDPEKRIDEYEKKKPFEGKKGTCEKEAASFWLRQQETQVLGGNEN